MFTLPNFIAFRADIDEEIVNNLNKVAKHNDFLIGHNRTVQSIKENSDIMLCYSRCENMPYGALINNEAVLENLAIADLLKKIVVELKQPKYSVDVQQYVQHTIKTLTNSWST